MKTKYLQLASIAIAVFAVNFPHSSKLSEYVLLPLLWATIVVSILLFISDLILEHSTQQAIIAAAKED